MNLNDVAARALPFPVEIAYPGLGNRVRTAVQILCVVLAIWVLIELSYEDSKKDDDERKPLRGK